MLEVSFYATTKDLRVGVRDYSFETFDNKQVTSVQLVLSTDGSHNGLSLSLSPDQAEKVAKALLAKVQQLKEEEVQE